MRGKHSDMSGTTYRDQALADLFGGPVDTITLSLPARSEFLSMARSVVAAAAARLPITYDEVDDIRLAATEAVGHLVIVSDSADAVVTIEIRTNSEALEVMASLDHLPPEWPPTSPEELLTWQILTGLVDSARFDTVAGTAIISFSKSTNTPV